MFFNKVILAGNLTRDPELRFTNSGVPVCDFGLAVNEKRRDREDEVLFIDVTAWREMGEAIANYKVKGDPILVEGKLKYHTWEDKQTGKNRSKIELTAQNVQFLGSKKDSNGNGGNNQNRQRTPSNAQNTGRRQERDISEDDFEDIPF